MEQVFGDIYFPPPSTVPNVVYKQFENVSATSNLMTRKEITDPLCKVQPGNSVFIVTYSHEGLSANLDSWKALAGSFPQLSIYIGIFWDADYVAKQLEEGSNGPEIGNLIGPGKVNPRRAWGIFSLDCLLQGKWAESPQEGYRFLAEKMKSACSGWEIDLKEYQAGGVRMVQMFFSGWNFPGVLLVR